MDSGFRPPFQGSLAYQLYEVCIESGIGIVANHRAATSLERENQCPDEIIDLGSGHASAGLWLFCSVQCSFKRVCLKLVQEVVAVVTDREFKAETILTF